MNDDDLQFVVGGINRGTYTADLVKFVQHVKTVVGTESDRFFITYDAIGETDRPVNDHGVSAFISLAE